MKVAEGSAPRAALSRLGRTVLVSLALSASAASVAACGSANDGKSASTPTPSAPAGAPAKAAAKPSGDITVWVDSVRLPAAKAYAAAHPDVHVKIVTYDGDANGAATLQTKIQL